MLAVEADGASVETVEGLAGPGAGLTALQLAVLDTGAAQCGFCIPGQLMSARALLATTPHPSRAEIEEGLAGNLCRCAGYEQIIEAVMLAAEAGEAGEFAEPRPADRTAGPTVDVAALPDANMAPQ